MGEPRKFCSHPFEYLFVGNAGSNWICCPAWLPHPVGATGALQPAQDWNSPAAQEIRASIHDGSFRHCGANCPFLATATGPVTTVDKVTDPWLKGIIAGALTVLEEGPRRIHAGYDASCNLACPSCRPGFHSASAAQRVNIDAVQDSLLAQLGPSVEDLIVTGSGDPFGSPSFRHLLETLEPAAYPKLKQISLHTNAQLWTPRSWARMARIHPLVKQAHISIDAARPETYAVNRRGGSYQRLLRNLDFIATLGLDITVSFVVQANNFAEMPEFVALGRERFDFKVLFTQLDDWGTFNSAEYHARAVHLPTHPDHPRLLRVLGHAGLATAQVHLGNLGNLMCRPRLAGAAPAATTTL